MTQYEQSIINQALAILNNDLTKGERKPFNSPSMAIDFLRLQLETEEQEVFLVMFLDQQNRLIEAKKMFFGTIDYCSIHPREVAKKCLEVNAAAVIISHNHPSGDSTPSQADIKFTKQIKEALGLFSIRILDHIIIGQGEQSSLAEDDLI
jgi:DNA repair protein RadC